MSDFDEHKIELANELRKANAMIASLEEKLNVAEAAILSLGKEFNIHNCPNGFAVCRICETLNSSIEALNKIRGEKCE